MKRLIRVTAESKDNFEQAVFYCNPEELANIHVIFTAKHYDIITETVQVSDWLLLCSITPLTAKQIGKRFLRMNDVSNRKTKKLLS